MDTERYIGLSLETAMGIFKIENTEWRLVSVDGKGYMVTCDFHPERLNISLENNIITNVTTG